MDRFSLYKTDNDIQNQIINNGIMTADRYVNRTYLINAASCNVLPLSEERKNNNAIRLYQIKKLVYDKEENINDKLISVYSSLLNIDSSAMLVIAGSKESVEFYIGIRSEANAAIAGQIIEKSFIGNFPGSILKNLRNSEIKEKMMKYTSCENSEDLPNVSCVTVVPSTRDEDKDNFVQGIEKFIDTMQGETYTAVLIAQPLMKQELELRKRGLEEMYSALSPFLKTSLAFGENYSHAVTNGMSESFAHSINNSINITNGKSDSVSRGRNAGFGVSLFGMGPNFGSSSNFTTGTSWSKAVTSGTSDTTTTGTTNSDTETQGSVRTLTTEHQNKSIDYLLKKINEQLERIKDCEGYGLWECASYFLAEDIQTSVIAANTYKALMLGDNTSVENAYVNVWDIRSKYQKDVLEYVRYGIHPLIETGTVNGFEAQIFTPGNSISGKELPYLMGVPHKSIPGIPVSSIAEFGRNVFVQDNFNSGEQIQIGKVQHMGKVEDTKVQLDLNSFASHCFITGSTGSGKSNTTYCLLEKFIENNIPFLVVEPAKGEYKEAFGNLDGIHIFTTSPLIGQMLKINPFSFDPQIHILEHIDRLIEIFNACWEMYAAMPAILKDAIEQAYVGKGWDLLNSVYLGEGEPQFPTFEDLMSVLPQIINKSGYSSDTKGDYIGALVTRVNSLTNGISGQVFCDCYEIPDQTLFNENTIIDLSRVGSAETKSLIMGILVLKLTEYRLANATHANSKLRHITVLEEAHNLLKQTKPGTAGSNVIGKSVEMICNSIAEMRTYGEGFIIVDQSPTSVDISAIKNTNTKIIMRLPEKEDCELAGRAVALNDDQIAEISRLEVGTAIVMQNNWLNAVLTKIDRANNQLEKRIEKVEYEGIRKLRGVVAKELINQYFEGFKVEYINEQINQVEVGQDKKNEMKCCVEQIVQKIESLPKNKRIYFLCDALLNVTGTKSLLSVNEHLLVAEKEGINKYTEESVNKWKREMRNGLKDYLDIPDPFIERLIIYLVVSQQEINNKIEYFELYKMIK